MSRPAISRRTFLASAGTAVACALSGALTGSSRAVADEPGFQIGVCDWSVGKLCDVGAFDLAKELGLDGVQVSLGTNANDMALRQSGIQQQFVEASRRTGVAIASLAIGELNNVPYKSEARTVEWVSDSIDTATALGTNVVLLAFFAAGDLRDDPKGIDTVVGRLRDVAPKAEAAGVILGLETWLSGPQHVAIMDRVASPAVQVYYDLGNSHLRGYDIYQEIRDLGRERICEVHAKDYDHIFGEGKVDFPEARRAMDDIGYRGWIHIEGAQPLGLMPSYRKDAAYLRTIFPPRI